MSKILIVGSSGFIGSNLVEKLQKEGHYVIGADIEKPKYIEPNEFHLSDFRIEADAAKAFSPDIDEAYCLACLMGGMGYIGDEEKYGYDIAIGSTQIVTNFIEFAKIYDVKKVFYSSSACCYNQNLQTDSKVVALKESDAIPASPDLLYGWQKLYAELMFMASGLDARIGRFHNVFGKCFDDKTEVLTRGGWKYFKEVSLSDEIASLNKENELEYLNPVAKQEYKYDGDMYLCEGKHNSQCVTPNHSVYSSSRSRKSFSLIEVSNLRWLSETLFFTSKFIWVGDTIGDEYILPTIGMTDGRRKHTEKTIKMKDWYEFIGWYISEGSKFKTPTNYTVCISQYEKTNSANRSQIKALLKRMNIHFSENKKESDIIISNKQVYMALELEGILDGSSNKCIPLWMLNAKTEYLKILFDALMKGDGDVSGNRYSTNSKKLANQFVELSLKLGKSTNYVMEKAKKPQHNDMYRVLLCDKSRYSTRKRNRSIIKYSGFVYDVTLPKNHILLVQRNGKVCWSGNCGTFDGGKEKAPAALTRKVCQAKDGGEIEVWGTGNQSRSFLHIDEALDGVERLMNSTYKKPINIGSDELVTINQLAEMIIGISGKKISIKNIPGNVGVQGRNSNNDLIFQELGWKPTKKLNEGLTKLYEFVNGEINKW